MDMTLMRAGAKVLMRDGHEAVYLGHDPITGKHRVRDHYSGPTVWLLDDDGFARWDHAESEHDCVGVV